MDADFSTKVRYGHLQTIYKEFSALLRKCGEYEKALDKAEKACLLLLKAVPEYSVEYDEVIENGKPMYLAPKAFHAPLDAAKAVMQDKIERKAKTVLSNNKQPNNL